MAGENGVEGQGEFQSGPQAETGWTFDVRQVRYSAITALVEAPQGNVTAPGAVIIPGGQFRRSDGVVPFAQNLPAAQVAAVNSAITHWRQGGGSRIFRVVSAGAARALRPEVANSEQETDTARSRCDRRKFLSRMEKRICPKRSTGRSASRL